MEEPRPKSGWNRDPERLESTDSRGEYLPWMNRERLESVLGGRAWTEGGAPGPVLGDLGRS